MQNYLFFFCTTVLKFTVFIIIIIWKKLIHLFIRLIKSDSKIIDNVKKDVWIRRDGSWLKMQIMVYESYGCDIN